MRCIPALSTLPNSGLDGCTFMCVGCTKRGAVLYVSLKPACTAAEPQHVLQGLYKPDGTPVFPGGMAIAAHNPTNARKQCIKTPSLIIIKFVLDQLPHIGTAGQLLYLSLTQNYTPTPAKLHHELIFFDCASAEHGASYATQVSKAVQ